MNLRVSGRDLIKNHLIMSLYNHAAVFGNNDANGFDHSMMPRWLPSRPPRPPHPHRAFYTNGFVVLDGEKMSKSQGNSLNMGESCVGDYHHPKTGASLSWTADVTRFTLACSGDGMEDANFDTKVANTTVLELYVECQWVKEVLAADLREGEMQFMDKVFLNTIADCVEKAYQRCVLRPRALADLPATPRCASETWPSSVTTTCAGCGTRTGG